jgi:hypothetical protein
MRASWHAAGAFGYFFKNSFEKCSDEHSTFGSLSGSTVCVAAAAKPERNDRTVAYPYGDVVAIFKLGSDIQG